MNLSDPKASPQARLYKLIAIVAALFILAFALGALMGKRIINPQTADSNPGLESKAAPLQTPAWTQPKVEVVLKGSQAASQFIQPEEVKQEEDIKTGETKTDDAKPGDKPKTDADAEKLKPETEADKPAADKPVADQEKPDKETKPEAASTELFRVRIGPFDSADTARKARQDLAKAGISTVAVGDLHLQAGAFKTKEGADALKRKLSGMGYPASIHQ